MAKEAGSRRPIKQQLDAPTRTKRLVGIIDSWLRRWEPGGQQQQYNIRASSVHRTTTKVCIVLASMLTTRVLTCMPVMCSLANTGQVVTRAGSQFGPNWLPDSLQ